MTRSSICNLISETRRIGMFVIKLNPLPHLMLRNVNSELQVGVRTDRLGYNSREAIADCTLFTRLCWPVEPFALGRDVDAPDLLIGVDFNDTKNSLRTT